MAVNTTPRKQQLVFVGWSRIIFVWAGIIFLCTVSYAAFSWARTLPARHTIVVEGVGRMFIKPDIATISFSVVSEGINVPSLQEDTDQKINKAIALVKELGIDAKDIKTAGYNLSPKYRYNQKIGTSSIDGYSLTQTVVVTVRVLDTAGKILGGLPALGINEISGPHLSVDDQDMYLNKARAEAFVKARGKAQALARMAGVRLGRVITFSENQGGDYPRPMYLKAEAVGGGVGGILPQIEPGSEEAQVIVSVTFEIW